MYGLPTTRKDHGTVFTYRKMLILDDDAGVSFTVALMARRLGLRVETCSTFTEFEAMLRTFEPDVLLIDLMMPGFDGIDVIARVRPACSAAIYVMSGADKRTYDASREVLLATNEQIEGFLQKPFSITDLAEALTRQNITPLDKISLKDINSELIYLTSTEFEKLVEIGGVTPFFQPIFDSRKRTLQGFEALLRISSHGGNEFPLRYFDYLTNSSALSANVFDVVTRQSLGFLASLGSETDISISVNVFGRDAVADGFRERLTDKCASFDLAPHRVILELSEATLCEFNEADLRKITQLRLAGFGLSIDDFGTQNSSLRRLANLPFSELKIDKSFCLALPASPPIEAIVEACLAIAHKLDMKVTAEGVESGGVADMLTNMGCDALQGYYFGKAMSYTEAHKWIKQGCPLSSHQNKTA